MCSPSCSIATRSRLVGSLRLNVETNRAVRVDGARPKKIAATIGSTASSRKSFSEKSSAAAAQAPTAALRVKVSSTATASAGMTSAAHIRSLPAEEHARQRGADDQHQQPRVGHVVAERALRTLAQVVVVQDAVLDDADGRARRRARHDDRHHRRGPLAGHEAVDERHDQEQHHLLVGKQADERRGREGRRHQRGHDVEHERPEEARRGEPLAAHRQERDPADERDGQQDLRDRDRELQRAGHAERAPAIRRFRGVRTSS